MSLISAREHSEINASRKYSFGKYQANTRLEPCRVVVSAIVRAGDQSMNPITHLFLSWTIADEAGLQPRDRAVVTWAGVVPDLDGLSLIPDLISRWLYGVQTGYYFEYHHFLTHGLPAAILTAVTRLLCGACPVEDCDPCISYVSSPLAV